VKGNKTEESGKCLCLPMTEVVLLLHRGKRDRERK